MVIHHHPKIEFTLYMFIIHKVLTFLKDFDKIS